MPKKPRVEFKFDENSLVSSEQLRAQTASPTETWSLARYQEEMRQGAERVQAGAKQRDQKEAKYVLGPVIEELQRFGWTYNHVYDSRKNEAGLPDIIAWKEGPAIFDLVVECKYGRKSPTLDQVKWLDHYEKKWRDDPYSWACVWRENDLEDIVRYLQRPLIHMPPGRWGMVGGGR